MDLQELEQGLDGDIRFTAFYFSVRYSYQLVFGRERFRRFIAGLNSQVLQTVSYIFISVDRHSVGS
jgi:hypothetical protein